MKYTIRYGKGGIALYRSYVTPLDGLPAIPESAYHGDPNIIFAVELAVEVLGDVFLPSYTEGDNTRVVPTATITNFALQKALGFMGSTREQFVHYLALAYLLQYHDMEALRLTVKEIPFHALPITHDSGATHTLSDRLLAPTFDVYSTADLTLGRDGIHALECGLRGIKLIKLTGSAFANFPQDEFTTLPQRPDRPLYIFMDMGWSYCIPDDAIQTDLSRYIAARQVYDVVAHVFHHFVSMSIQHLVHEMGQLLLARFPQMESVWFDAQNRLWDTAADHEGEASKVFMDPRPPFGHIYLRMSRDEA